MLRDLLFTNPLFIAVLVVPLSMWDLSTHLFRKKTEPEVSDKCVTMCAVVRTVSYLLLTLLFALGIFYYRGSHDGWLFVTGFVLEYSLSVDNLFVFLLIMRSFSLSMQMAEKVLAYGIITTLLLRCLFIFFGLVALERFHWIMIIFGLVLIFTAIKLSISLLKRKHGVHADHQANTHDLKNNVVVKAISRLMPMASDYQGTRLFCKRNGKWHMTRLLLAMIMVIASDIVCAFDSIPVIFAITRDTFIIYTSNMFAVMGLRSLYVALVGLVYRLRYIEYGLVMVLLFMGIKVFVNTVYPNAISVIFILIFVILVMTCSALFSVYRIK